MNVSHLPVMLEEVVEMLKVKKSGVYIDGTVGSGGHAKGILKSVQGECTFIGIDKDEQALSMARQVLQDGDVHLVRESFSNMVSVMRNLGYKEADGILLDLGVSTVQLKSEGRGFSFLRDEPLDMRMDNRQALTALTVVNDYPETELAHIIWQYGEERLGRRIARAIVSAREKQPIRTCRELSRIIEKTAGRRGRIHPATKTFQALRIEVNKELSELSMAINTGINILKAEGRFCILSYHSLEDRIVKHSFKELAQKGMVSIITKKPLVPRKEEQRLNPSSRSAKLRTVEKL